MGAGRTAATSRRSWSLLLLHAVLIHTVTLMLRPTMSYRALELGVAPAWLGAVSASYALLPLFVAVLVGRVTDRRGERGTLLAGAALVVAAAAGLTLFGASVATLVVWNAVLGLGQLLSMVGEQTLVANWSAPHRRDTAFGHYTFAASLGQAVGPAIAAVLGGQATVPDTGRVFTGAVAVAGAALVCTLPLRPPHARPATAAGRHDGVRLALRVPNLGRAVVASLTVLAAVDLLVIYLPAFGAERGIAADDVGALLAVRAAASMASRFFLGTLVRRVGRGRLLVGGLGISALAVAVLPVPMPVAALGIVIAGAGLALGVVQPLTMSWVVEAAPPHLRATALALRLTGNRVGQTVIPAAVGLVASASGVAGVLWATAAALALVAATTARGSPDRTSRH
jgi:MFS family permease